MPQQTTDDFRWYFNTKIRELFERKGRYNWIMNRLNEFSSNETSKKNHYLKRIYFREDLFSRRFIFAKIYFRED